MLQTTNPYVQEALESLNAIISGGRFDTHREAILDILERLHDDSYNEGLEAERRPL